MYDWDLQIKSQCKKGKYLKKEYTREQINGFKNFIIVKGIENKKMIIRFKLAEGESKKNYKMSAEGYEYLSEKPKKEDDDEQVVKFVTKLKPGFHDFHLGYNDGKGKSYNLTLRVDAALKTGDDNREIYNSLCNVIRRWEKQLYSLYNPSKITQTKDDNIISSIEEQFQAFKVIKNELEDILYNLNPDKKSSIENRIKKIWEIKISDLDLRDIYRSSLIKIENRSISSHLKGLHSDKKGYKYIPQFVALDENLDTYNTPANQILKGFIILIENCVKEFAIKWDNERFKQRFNKEHIEKIDRYIKMCYEYLEDVQYLKNYPFLAKIDEIKYINTDQLYLLEDANYLELLDIIENFLKGPIFRNSEFLSIPVIKPEYLYEYGTFIGVARTLANECIKKGWLMEKNIILDRYGNSHLYDIPPKESLLELSKDNKKICLYYKKPYGKYYAKSRREHADPDISIELINESGTIVMILDAKYRSILRRGEDLENPMDKMALYMQSIKLNGRCYVVQSAFAIYLGYENIIRYVDEKMKKDAIGAIGWIPGKNDSDFERTVMDIIKVLMCDNIGKNMANNIDEILSKKINKI